MPEPIVQAGLTPFDLQAPARILVPWPHQRGPGTTRSLKLGQGEDAAILEVHTWNRCRSSCRAPYGCAAGTSVRLQVPCDALPHCSACECGSGHDFVLTDEQVAELKAVLP